MVTNKVLKLCSLLCQTILYNKGQTSDVSRVFWAYCCGTKLQSRSTKCFSPNCWGFQGCTVSPFSKSTLFHLSLPLKNLLCASFSLERIKTTEKEMSNECLLWCMCLIIFLLSFFHWPYKWEWNIMCENIQYPVGVIKKNHCAY